MAMLLKDRYHLKTLRCWIGYRESPDGADGVSFPSKRVLRTQLYEGSQEIGGPVDTAFDALGLDAEGYLPTKSWPAPLELTGIAEQLRTAAAGEPAAVWLHIKQDSFPLALLPWEEMAGPIIDTPLLRIGNFVDDPYRPAAAPVIAVCASQPIGDGPFQLSDFVMALLSVIDQATRWTEVHPRVSVFADAQWLPAIRLGVDALKRPGLDIQLVDPPLEQLARGTDRPGSVWLKWIADHYAGTTVDVVHFITPGWFAENHGAIALADTPISNVGGGEFVAATELAAFYDALGCSGMAFSSPDMPQWEWGQRMLAFELSWLRPGPLLVFEHGAQDYDALESIYRLLFGGGWPVVQDVVYAASPPQLTCHPQILARVEIEGVGEPDSLPRAEPGDLLSRQVEQAIAQLQPTRSLSMAERWEATGAAGALDFVKSLN